MKKTNKKILKKIYKKRPAYSKKYDFGLLLVIGGSQFYSGSPALAGLAAFRAGVDMVYIIAPKRAADIVASFAPDLAAYPLKGDYLSKNHLSSLLTMTESARIVSNGKTAVVIGGGLGRTPAVQEVILEYLSQISVPVVIDADCIYAIARKPQVIFGKPFLITPHSYEFYVLTNQKIYHLSDKEKIKIVQKEAEKLNTTILLKGNIDIISNGKETVLNKTGSPYMTIGGSGDVLAGVAGALMARGIPPFLSAQAAAFINGMAGQLGEKNFGEGLMASDLIALIPQVLKLKK